MLHLALLGVLSIAGTVVDFSNGRPLANVAVSVARDDAQNAMTLSGSHATPGVVTILTDAQGRFHVAAPSDGPMLVAAYGETSGHVTYHGSFAHPPRELRIRLIAPTREEQHALSELNAFRQIKSLALHAPPLPALTFDENLMETSRYWARMQQIAGRIGHTCATLGNPQGCVEFNAYLHALPGAIPQEYSGQNAAFDSEPSWSDSLGLFENEGVYCAPAYDWRRCDDGREGSITQTGHFKNLMIATRWVGFGKATSPSGGYFAQNVL